jgi:hypothetical protein
MAVRVRRNIILKSLKQFFVYVNYCTSLSTSLLKNHCIGHLYTNFPCTNFLATSTVFFKYLAQIELKTLSNPWPDKK